MVGAHRVGSACLSLQFDRYLDSFDTTYVVSPLQANRLDSIFNRYGIDTANFVYLTDKDVEAQVPQVRNWNLPEDYRGSWLYQQALKMAVLDSLDHDMTLIQDADTFCVAPYSCEIDGRINLWHLPNISHAWGYYESLRQVVGIPRQTEHCFVCDMQPVKRDDWRALRDLVGQRHSRHWLDAMIDFTPWDYVANCKWFSEYEMLGNWTVHRNPDHVLTIQHRLNVLKLEQLTVMPFPATFNVISDKNPRATSIGFDYATDTALNYDQVWPRLQTLLV